MAKRIGILTAGSDCPGLNAAIRAVGKTARNSYGMQILGFQDGFQGLVQDRTLSLEGEALSGILSSGGTILGTSREQPNRIMERGQAQDMLDTAVANIKKHHLDALVCIGGRETQLSALHLMQKGVNVVTLPKAIDNIIPGTDVSIGFNTALDIATEAIDRLHTTAEAHHRVMVLELMGREAGFIALHAGISGGADVILIPEIPFKFEAVLGKIRRRIVRGSLFSILAVSEGAKPLGGNEVFSRSGDEMYVPRLGGVGHLVGEYIEEQGYETRVTVLGHLQRGGTPTAFDRWLATRYGAAAVRLAARGGFDRMVSLRSEQITDVTLEEALAVPRRVDLNGDAVLTARGMGIAFGDE